MALAGLDVPVEHIDFDWRTMFRMGHTTTRFDFIIRMPSLPYLFHTTPETIPAEIPYLAADPARADNDLPSGCDVMGRISGPGTNPQHQAATVAQLAEIDINYDIVTN